MTAKGEFFPSRINVHVPNMKYAADVRYGGVGRIKIPAMIALDADGILAATSIATAVDTSTFASTYTALKKNDMGKFGRNVTVVASGAATSAVVVYGEDYLGQTVIESFTLNGSTPVLGKKAFKRVTRVTAAVTAATTINVGWGNTLGLPYKIQDIYTELADKVEATAGTVVVGSVATPSATTGDPRGTYLPHSSAVPDGSRVLELVGLFDVDNLHGIAHYAG